VAEISLHEAIFTTRAMRHFKSDPVSIDDIEYVLEAATMAPSAGNIQMWAFVVVTEDGLRKKLGEAYRESGNGYIRDTVLSNADTPPDQRRVYERAMHNVNHLEEAPVIIVACLTTPCPENADIASGLFGSIYPAIQNLQLAARARELGTVLLTLATDYSPIKLEKAESIREVLNLPDNVQSVALIPIGHPKGSWGRPWRKPASESTHWNGWQKQ
jgi:nitroreductase